MYEALDAISLGIMAAANLGFVVYFLTPRRRPWGVAPEDSEEPDFPPADDPYDALWWDCGGGEGGGA